MFLVCNFIKRGARVRGQGARDSAARKLKSAANLKSQRLYLFSLFFKSMEMLRKHEFIKHFIFSMFIFETTKIIIRK